MAKISHLDLATKHICLAAGVREFHPVDDIYKEIRALRRTNESLRGFDTPVFASGNVAKGGGKFTPRLTTFRCGWKIVPEDTPHTLYVTGEQITDEGEAGPACFDLEPLSPTSKVIIQYEPPSAEVIMAELGEVALESSVQYLRDIIGTPTSPTIADDLDAIEAKVNNLPDDPANQSMVEAYVSTEIANLLTEIETLLKKIEPIRGMGPRYRRVL